MKRAVMLTLMLSLVPVMSARAEDKPDCSAQKTAVTEAQAAAKVKPDLTTCKELKGQEKKDCETPLKDKAKEDVKAAKVTLADAKKALACCNNPKKKGCDAP